MNDQAERLRQIISLNKSPKSNNLNTIKTLNKTRVFAITSGKGGVGKTNFTINLAISLSRLGHKIIVFDADIGLANIDIILGVIPKYTIANVISGEKDILDIMVDGPNGIKIIAGGSGIRELSNLSSEKLEHLTSQLSKLEEFADFILIDTGAGLSNTVLNFVNAAGEVILITTPEPTSLTDVYAMIKTLTITGKYNKLHVVINRVEDSKEANEVYEKLYNVTNRFLNIRIENLGYLYNSKLVGDSVKSQTPFIMLYPDSQISKKINGIAMKIAGNKEVDNNVGINNFINKLRSLFVKEDI